MPQTDFVISCFWFVQMVLLWNKFSHPWYTVFFSYTVFLVLTLHYKGIFSPCFFF